LSVAVVDPDADRLPGECVGDHQVKVVIPIHIPGGDTQTRDRAGFDFECTVGLCTQYDFDLVSIRAIHPAARVSDRQVGVAIAIEVGKRKTVVQPDR
jgi:hypothetical protein